MLKKSLGISLINCLFLLFMNCLAFSAEQTKVLTYENEVMGVKIDCPEGWFMTSGDKAQEVATKAINDFTSLESIKEASKKIGILVVFSKYQFGSPREYNPSITLVTEPIPGELREYVKSPFDYANANILNIKSLFKDSAILKEPTEVTLGGSQGATFTYEGTIVRGYLEIRIKSTVYVFIKDDTGYALTFTDKASDFDGNLSAFESSTKTFELK